MAVLEAINLRIIYTMKHIYTYDTIN